MSNNPTLRKRPATGVTIQDEAVSAQAKSAKESEGFKLSSEKSKEHISERKSIAYYFSQQKLRAWQPVVTPNRILSVFFVLGLFFGLLGIIALVTNAAIIECSILYGDPAMVCEDVAKCTTKLNVEIKDSDCVGPLSGNKIKGPIFVYYGLKNYYQNHRRYVRSRNDAQLSGKIITTASELSTCNPVITGDDGRILSPCGLIAWSVFNDTFKIYDNAGEIQLDDSADTIAWAVDVQHRFKNPLNPDTSKINEWLSEDIFPNKVENAHFIVWMRPAPLPKFRKLYAKITEDITLPVQVEVMSRFPVQGFGGEKKIILSTLSWLGGRDFIMGTACLFLSVWCIIFCLYCVIQNRKKARIVGDVRHLFWLNSQPTNRQT